MKKLLFILFVFVAAMSLSSFEIDYDDLINLQKESLTRTALQNSRHYFDPIVNEVYPTYLTMPMLYSMFNCTSVHQEYIDSTGTWATVGSTTIEYNGEGVSRVNMTYNYGGQPVTVSYNVVWAGGQISHIEMSMDYMGSPTVIGRESYTWVTEGISSCLVQVPDMINGGWVDSQQWTYTYNGSELTEVLIQEYGWDRPEDSEKYVLTWAGGHVSTMTLYWYDGSAWQNDENELFTYDGDNMTVEIDQYWESGTWMNEDKTEYIYNGNKPMSWDDFSWDMTDWYNDSRGTITYNNDDKPSVFLSQELVDTASREWVDSGRLTYGYGVGISENTVPVFKTNLKCYPNPFNPQTALEFSLPTESNVEISIYNIKGQKVVSLENKPYSKGTHKIIWNADKQASGIYFAILKTKFGISRQKLVLLK